MLWSDQPKRRRLLKSGRVWHRGNTVWLASHKPGNDGLRHWLFLFWCATLIHFKTRRSKSPTALEKQWNFQTALHTHDTFAAFWSASRRLWFYRVATWSSLTRSAGGVTIQKWNGSTPFPPDGGVEEAISGRSETRTIFLRVFWFFAPELLSSGLPLRPRELRILLSPQPYDRDRAHPRPRGAPSIAGPPPPRRRRCRRRRG